MILANLVVLLIAGLFVQTTNGACAYLPTTEAARRSNPCVGTVTYSYYIPATKGAGYFEELARSKLNSTLLMNLSPTCQQGIVNYVCSQVYKKCTTSNYMYLNDTGVSSRYLPFIRPCVSVCTDLSTTCSADPLFKLTPLASANCYSTTDYGYGSIYTFDLKNSANCYVPSATDSFASSVETYIQGADKPCSGLVDTFVSIPGYKINSTYTTLMRPYIAQTLINAGLSAAFAELPPYMDEECHLALKQYFCYQYFLKPDPRTFQAALTYSLSVNTNAVVNAYKAVIPTTLASKFGASIMTAYVNLPSYPDQSFCTAYTDKCAAFRARANESSLEPECDKVTSGIYSFPSANQTIVTKIINIVGSNGLALHFQSQPDTQGYVDSNYEFTTTCPPDYAVNTNEGDKNVREVTGTGCAVACQSGFWTPSEWDYFRDSGIAMTIVSIVLAVICMGLIVALKDWEDSYLMFIYATLSIISSSGHLSLNSAKSFQIRYCENAVTPHRIDNGPSPCVGTAVVSSYLYMVLCLIIFFMSVQRMLFVRKQSFVLSSPWYITTQALLILLPPLAPMIAAIVREKFGYNGVLPWCSMDLVIASYVMGFPTVVVSFFTYTLWLASSGIMMFSNNYMVIPKKAPEEESKKGENDEEVQVVKAVEMTEKEQAAAESAPAVAAEEGSSADNAVVLHEAPSQALGTEDAPVVAVNTKDIEEANGLASPSKYSVGSVDFIQSELFRRLKYEVVLGSVVFCSFALYLGFILLKFRDHSHYDTWRDSFVTWTKCVFNNWDGESSDFESVCGTHLSSRPTIPAVNLYQLIQFAPMIVIGPPFILSYVYAYFRARHLMGLHSERELIPSTV